MTFDSATVSVVVPTYNRRQSLSRTLSNLFSQSFAADRYEVVVVVDGSTDGTDALLRDLQPRCGLRVVEQANRGLAAARNAGVRAASGDIIIFIDDDIACGATLVSEHASAHHVADECVALGPTLVAQDGPATLVSEQEGEWRQQWIASVDTDGRPRWPVDFWVGHNTSLARPVFIASGGYDERFGKFEEYELAFRLRQSGVRFRWQPAAKTYHVNTKSVRQVLHEDAGPLGASEYLLCRKYPEYRPYARLARLAEGPRLKRAMRQAGARIPFSPALLLEAPLAAAERICGPGKIRTLAGQLLGRCVVSLSHRAAVREAGSWEAFYREFGMRLPVLAYHHVGPRVSNIYPGLTISPDRFEQQIQWLVARGYRGIRPSDWLAWRRHATPLPAKPILITFDDGYADIAQHAFPVLSRYGFAAGAFVVTGQIGATNAWDESQGYGTVQLMTAEQIRRWAGNGIEFGAHTRTHPDLTALTPEKLGEEIAGSADDLEKITGIRPVSFAYPYGLYNEAVREVVSSAFDLAVTCDSGINELVTDPYRLRRSEVASTDSWTEYKWRVRLGWLPTQRIAQSLPADSRAAAMARAVAVLMRPRTSPE